MYVLSHGFLLSFAHMCLISFAHMVLRTRPSFICTHDSSCHVTSLSVATNVSSYSMPSFCENPHATNVALYPTMLSPTAYWIL